MRRDGFFPPGLLVHRLSQGQIRAVSVSTQFCRSRNGSRRGKARRAYACMAKGFDEAWAHFCPSKPCLPLSIDVTIGFAQVRRICRLWAAGAKGIFSFAKENIPFGTPRERLRLAVSGLNNSDVSEVNVPRARRCRVSIARRFASAPTIRCCAAVGGSAALRMRYTPCGCRSAHLIEVQPNSRLPPVATMRRAKQCRYFARSLPPR